jgi:hypothetical protein
LDPIEVDRGEKSYFGEKQISSDFFLLTVNKQ